MQLCKCFRGTSSLQLQNNIGINTSGTFQYSVKHFEFAFQLTDVCRASGRSLGLKFNNQFNLICHFTDFSSCFYLYSQRRKYFGPKVSVNVLKFSLDNFLYLKIYVLQVNNLTWSSPIAMKSGCWDCVTKSIDRCLPT